MKQTNRLTAFIAAVTLVLLAGCAPDAPDDGASAQKDPPTSGEAQPAKANDPVPEVVVLVSDALVPWLEDENWWGENLHGEQLDVPHLMIAAIKPAWQVNAQKLPVAQKKEVFYRFMLPLVLHANEMVMDRREGLLRAQRELDSGSLSADSLALLRRLVLLLPGFDEARAAALGADDPELPGMIDDLLRRVDIIPPGLALGQAAYESGYGTSRFAVEGNSLFGQWTYGGDGIKPKEQRSSKGDHRIKAFDWPFDSVRGYYINLMSHRAYEDFRALRAELRAAGKPLDSLTLADGLLSYSERGQAYVDTLKGIIRTNKLDVADRAVFRDEPIRFIVTEQTREEAEATREELARMRASGELAEILERMNLD
ncbi:MAG: glucosaminidase domain-containing protein [Xanthomonadales bacterium]